MIANIGVGPLEFVYLKCRLHSALLAVTTDEKHSSVVLILLGVSDRLISLGLHGLLFLKDKPPAVLTHSEV